MQKQGIIEPVPATFKHLIENVLGDLRCLIYLDNVIVHASTFERELERLRLVLSRLRAANLKLNPKKCELFRCKVRFLSHVVCAEGVTTDLDKIEAVKTWPVLRNAKERRLGDLLDCAPTTGDSLILLGPRMN